MGQIGYHFIYLFQQHEIKEMQELEVLKKLPRSELVRIENNDAIQWEEPKREFYLNNMLYDVVETTVEDNKIIYYAIDDQKEKKIIDQLSHISKQLNDHDGGKGQDQKIIKIEFPNFLIENNSVQLSGIEVSIKKYMSHQDRIINADLLIEAPPPKI